jgi:hypothetical protein
MVAVIDASGLQPPDIVVKLERSAAQARERFLMERADTLVTEGAEAVRRQLEDAAFAVSDGEDEANDSDAEWGGGGGNEEAALAEDAEDATEVVLDGNVDAQAGALEEIAAADWQQAPPVGYGYGMDASYAALAPAYYVGPYISGHGVDYASLAAAAAGQFALGGGSRPGGALNPKAAAFVPRASSQ